MKFKEKIKILREARDDNKLVIFVGSGVSANSQIPTWTELIEVFAKKIPYDRCSTCKDKTSACPIPKCKLKSHFCQDEYLKIPQYFYDTDTSTDHKNYKNIILKTLSCNKESNKIDDIILRLRPHHIITTNYDKLLENSKEPNRQLYSVVTKDKDLFLQERSQYIIKMHGDIDNIDEIVLKENDYILYEQKHLLIQTYIKSLLIDHTFLFVGYSLNDYNLKIILGWINYLAEDQNKAKHFIVQSSKSPHYEEKYFSENNVLILCADEVPKELLDKHNSLPLEDVGIKLYALLDYILDEKNDYLVNPLIDVLYEKYQILDFYNKISYEDLKNLHTFSSADLKGDTLVFYIEEEFNKYKKELDKTSKSAKYVKKILLKTGILAIRFQEKIFEISAGSISNNEDELFNIYLNNEYFKLLAFLDNIDNKFAKAYYYFVCIPECINCFNELEKINEEISASPNIILNIFFKFNCLLHKQLTQKFVSHEHEIKELRSMHNILPEKVKMGSVFFNKIFNVDVGTSISKMKDLLNKHEEIYLNGKNSIFYGSNLGHIVDLQTLAYDYYLYFKRNYLFLDFFSNPKNYLQYYLKSILCTYSPSANTNRYEFWDFGKRDSYSLNKIDVDMFSKFTEPKELKLWIKEYKVKKINLDNDINITKRFKNFCNSISLSKNEYVFNQLVSFSILLSICKLDEDNQNEVIESITKLVNNHVASNYKYINSILEAISNILDAFPGQNESYRKLLETLINPEIIENISYSKNIYISILMSLSKNKTKPLISRIRYLISKNNKDIEKCSYLYIFRSIVNIGKSKKYIGFLVNNLNLLSPRELFIFVVEKHIPYSNIILHSYIDKMKVELDRRLKQPGTRAYPDNLTDSINYCILLYLLEFPIEINRLNNYSGYSDYLKFLLSPDDFDFSKIDITDYMWCNFFKNKNLLDKLKEHKKDIVTDNLLYQLKNGLFTIDQYKIVFGKLLDEEEIWNFE